MPFIDRIQFIQIEHLPEFADWSKAFMNCPKCEHLLARVRYAGVNVLQCDQCGGHLVENHRVKTIERRVDKDLNALMAEIVAVEGLDTAHKVRCPRCRARMVKKEIRAQRKFRIDECRNCDLVWLDGGELAEIQFAFGTKEQTAEVNRMRERLATMSEAEKNEYEARIANLIEIGTEMELLGAVADEMSHQFYFQFLRQGRFS